MKFLADESLHGPIVRALHSMPDFDLVRVQDMGLAGASDPRILEWAAREHRVLLTHDRNTFPKSAYERIDAGEHVAGVIVIADWASIATVCEELELISNCLVEAECENQVFYLPIRW